LLIAQEDKPNSLSTFFSVILGVFKLIYRL